VESYLVVVSDGADNCDAPGVRGGYDPDEFAALGARLYADMGIMTIVIGFGGEAEPDQLNAIAANGGTEFTEFFDAEDGDALRAALDTIGESVHVSCTFEIGSFDPSEVNLNLVNVYFDDAPVPRDEGCAAGQGWTWTDDSRTTLEFCEDACTALESGDVTNIAVEIMCSEDQVIVV
jgi:hypothetical protein